jgi:hypothetical protein
MPSITVEEAFEFALERRKAGFVSEAEDLYLRILSIDTIPLKRCITLVSLRINQAVLKPQSQ